MLRAGGKCGVVIINTFLSNADNASVALRKQLLEECNLYAILELPRGAFTGTGVKTVVLFFEKGFPTKNIWYYQLNPGRSLGKTNALNEADLAEFVALEKNKALSDNSWVVSVDSLNKETWDLTPSNHNKKEIQETRTPNEIMGEIEAIDIEVSKALAAIKEML